MIKEDNAHIVKLASSLLMRMLTIVIVDRSGNFVSKLHYTNNLVLCDGSSVEEFSLIILRLK